MIKEAIQTAVEGKDLTSDTVREVMDEIMTGNATETEMAAYLTALRMKKETIEEITASAQGMREHGVKLNHKGDLLEIVGTGGDKAFTFNISTISSFVVSAAGIPVAKHGNRSVSSKCGAADVLESLGVNLNVDTDKNEKILDEIGVCFMFAQKYHSSMRYVGPVRKALGIRTIFNILGPLANPAGANMQLLGVYDEALIEPMAKVLKNLGIKNAMVVRGDDGLDEITLTTTTKVCEIRDGLFRSYILDPRDYGLELCDPKDLVGGDPEANKDIAISILKGEKGPKRDVVILNSATCIHIATGKEIKECIDIARDMIDSGKAYEQLAKLVKLTNE